MKKIVLSILVITSFVLSICNVYADDIIDFSKKGSIDIVLTEKESNKAINGAMLGVYKVADAKLDNANLVYETSEEVKSCKIDFSKIDDRTITEGMVDCIKNTDTFSTSETTNEKGKVSFTDLDLGLYMVVQINKVKGYSNIDAFLVMIPQVINNKWVYDIDCEPKTDILKLIDISVKKVWNNEGRTNPDKVVIQLIRDELVVDTVTLNDANNWSFVWEDLQSSDKYSVVEVNVPENYEVTYRKDGNDFTVTNTAKLAQTGMLLWKIMAIAGTGLTFLVVGLVMKNKYE